MDDEGAPVGVGPFTTLNFAGAGVIASDAGGGTALVTIPGGGSGIDVADEGAPVGVGPFTTLNFAGAGVIASDAGGGTALVTIPGVAADSAVIFDDAVPADKVNIRSDRASNQSPIDNTKIQITNLGSQDLNINPAATGATGNGATIGGGDDNTASGDYATVPGGSGNTASGSNSYAEGGGTTASGANSHTEGSSTQATGGQAHAEGKSTQATANNAHAEGYNSSAPRSGQHAHSSGPGGLDDATAGYTQESKITMAGYTDGLAPGETVELTFGDAAAYFELEDGHAYAIVVTAIANGSGSAIQAFKQMFAVRRNAGTTTIEAAGALEQIGNALVASWALTASVGAAPDRFALTFSTGLTTYAARITARVEFVEIVKDLAA